MQNSNKIEMGFLLQSKISLTHAPFETKPRLTFYFFIYFLGSCMIVSLAFQEMALIMMLQHILTNQKTTCVCILVPNVYPKTFACLRSNCQSTKLKKKKEKCMVTTHSMPKCQYPCRN